MEVKVSDVGVSDATGAGAAVPVPERATVCGEPAALSAMESDAVNVATDDGVKMIEMVQFEPAAMDVPQVLVWAKVLAPVPVSMIPEMVSAALPVLLSLTV